MTARHGRGAGRALSPVGAVAAVVAALTLAACGSSGSSSTSRASTQAPAASTSAGTTPASSSTPTSATTTSAGSTTARATGTAGTGTATTSSGSTPRIAQAPLCRSGSTAVSAGGGGVGLGHIGVVLLFRNTSAHACMLQGYPGAALVSPSGAEVNAVRTLSGYLGGLSAGASAPPAVPVAAGATVSALLEGVDSSTGGGSCPTYPRLLVTPPSQVSTVSIARALSMCSPQIHPVVAGMTGREG